MLGSAYQYSSNVSTHDHIYRREFLILFYICNQMKPNCKRKLVAGEMVCIHFVIANASFIWKIDDKFGLLNDTDKMNTTLAASKIELW